MTILHVVPKVSGLAGDVYTASHYFSTDVAVGPGDEVDVGDRIRQTMETWYAIIAGQIRTAITALEIAIAIYDIATDIETHWFDTTWTFAGTNASESFPPQVSSTISFGTVGGQRPGQKRLWPFAETMANNGVLVSGAVTNMLTMGSAMTVPQVSTLGTTFTPGIRSTFGGLQFRALDGSVTVPDVVGTVRTRKPGIGT